VCLQKKLFKMLQEMMSRISNSMQITIGIVIFNLTAIVTAQINYYETGYSCFKDCGYYRWEQYSDCIKYRNDYCWISSRRTWMIIGFIVLGIAITIGAWFFVRYCRKRQIKSRPTSPPPGSMCIWQA